MTVTSSISPSASLAKSKKNCKTICKASDTSATLGHLACAINHMLRAEGGLQLVHAHATSVHVATLSWRIMNSAVKAGHKEGRGALGWFQ